MSNLLGQARPSHAFLRSLHPGGDPERLLSIDQPGEPGTTDRKSDVLALTMTDAQCRDATHREAMIDRAVSALAPDGIMWLGVPGRWRSALMIALRAKGLVIGGATSHLGRGVARTEFALTDQGLRWAIDGGHVSRRWQAALAVLQRVPLGKAMLLRLLPGVGFTAFQPGTRPFGWLLDQLAAPHVADIALTTNWRGEGSPFLVFALSDGETLIAKRGGPESQAAITQEARLLKQLGDDAAKAGLAVPQLIDLDSTPRLCSLIETGVSGRPMAVWIREGRHRDLGAIADRLATWLGRWNGQTLRHVELTTALGEMLILSAARELADTIDQGDAYLDWLSRETGRLIGHKVPLVAAHNDLTMANVLGDRSGICSVVDWEAANPDGLPLTDFHYAACDAATAIGGGDRLAAFRACFLDDGEPLQRLRQCEERLRAVVSGPREWLELCIHAGWLRHAANELARPAPRPNEAFIAIAGVLALSVSGR